MDIVVIDLPLETELRLSSKKRWRLALSMIKCLNAFRHYSKQNHSAKLFQAPSYRYLLKIPDRKVSPKQSDRLSIDVDDNDDDEEHPRCFQNLDQSSLAKIVKEKSLEHLANLGGIGCLSSSLDTNLDDGIYGDDQDISRRNQAFGSNTYSKPPTKDLVHLVWEAFVIAFVCAVLERAFGIKEDGIKVGWWDRGSMFVNVFRVIFVSALINFRQSRLFDKLLKISKNIPVEVVRAGRRRQVSIFEIVVGDIVCLKIGDQVPADGLLVEGHSLQVDESSLTGKSDHVRINHYRNPFLMSGTKVAAGHGRFLVTSVGMNTAWGAMMTKLTSDSDLNIFKPKDVNRPYGKMQPEVTTLPFHGSSLRPPHFVASSTQAARWQQVRQHMAATNGVLPHCASPLPAGSLSLQRDPIVVER